LGPARAEPGSSNLQTVHMSYYDKIASQWHLVTGYKGGAFKEHVLNDVLLRKLPPIDNCSILELGAGNGYFLPLVLRHFSGQIPSSIIITDISAELLKIAQEKFRIPDAQYQHLDIRGPFPFENDRFDRMIATMVLNEIPPNGFNNALQECYRTLSADGTLLITVTHPDFIDSLHKRGLLMRSTGNTLTMPSTGSLRLPVIVRPAEIYRTGLAQAGFEYEEEAVYPTAKVIAEKSGLRNVGTVPLALVFRCTKPVKL
jgi:SAM-dependent methyltransferase